MKFTSHYIRIRTNSPKYSCTLFRSLPPRLDHTEYVLYCTPSQIRGKASYLNTTARTIDDSYYTSKTDGLDFRSCKQLHIFYILHTTSKATLHVRATRLEYTYIYIQIFKYGMLILQKHQQHQQPQCQCPHSPPCQLRRRTRPKPRPRREPTTRTPTSILFKTTSNTHRTKNQPHGPIAQHRV